MKDVVNRVIEHPFASWFIISATLSGIADIVRAVKGEKREPVVSVTSNEPVPNEEES